MSHSYILCKRQKFFIKICTYCIFPKKPSTKSAIFLELKRQIYYNVNYKLISGFGGSFYD